jgi:hypothetical protein
MQDPPQQASSSGEADTKHRIGLCPICGGSMVEIGMGAYADRVVVLNALGTQVASFNRAGHASVFSLSG